MQSKPKLTPRHMRAINALRNRPVMREELDRLAGCSNSPELVRQLRCMGLDIDCQKVPVIDRDGKICKSGRYEFAPEAMVTLRTWGLEAA